MTGPLEEPDPERRDGRPGDRRVAGRRVSDTGRHRRSAVRTVNAMVKAGDLDRARDALPIATLVALAEQLDVADTEHPRSTACPHCQEDVSVLDVDRLAYTRAASLTLSWWRAVQPRTEDVGGGSVHDLAALIAARRVAATGGR